MAGKYLELLNREKCRTMLPLLWTENGKMGTKKRGMPRLFGHRQGVENGRKSCPRLCQIRIAQLTDSALFPQKIGKDPKKRSPA